MRSLVVVDVESTGLDPKTDRIIELGAALYSVEHRTMVECFSTLVEAEGNAAEEINRIPASALPKAPSWLHAAARLNSLVEQAECYGDACFVAHRAEFDRGFISAVSPKVAEHLPWICSKFDIEWPCSKVGASCVEMALAHGVPVVSAHRALTDCFLIAKTCEAVQAMGHDLPTMLRRAMRPKAIYVANTPKPWDLPDEEWAALKGKLVAAGFRFDNQLRQWRARIAVEDAGKLPFEVTQVDPKAA